MTEPAAHVSDKLRLFFAASIAPELQNLVGEAAASLHESLSGARWTAQENLHVTLKFLGATPAAELDAVSAAAETAARTVGAGRIALRGIGAFPSARRARVLWVGIEDGNEVLLRAASALDRALEPLGFPAEKRPFSAHLTIARFKAPARLPDGLELGTVGDAFPVTEIDLYQSRLSPEGARYKKLRSFKLV